MTNNPLTQAKAWLADRSEGRPYCTEDAAVILQALVDAESKQAEQLRIAREGLEHMAKKHNSMTAHETLNKMNEIGE